VARLSLGDALLGLGSAAEAGTEFARATAGFRALGKSYWEPLAVARHGDALAAAGDLPRARERWTLALRALSTIDRAEAGPLRAKLAATTPATPRRRL